MKATGIIAEYNPLHNGHVYHMDQARDRTGADAVIVAMSGNFVQRGEPAFFDKWTRAEHALKCGADLVVEIPVLFCLGNAGQYAGAGVRLLEATGKVSHISFGSKSGETDLLCKIAEDFTNYSGQISEEIIRCRKKGFSFPAARELAYFNIVHSDAANTADHKAHKILNDPNDILALEYIMAMRKAEPVAVKRAGAGYDDPYDQKFAYQSASALRTQAFSGRDISRYVPECVVSEIRTGNMAGTRTGSWFDILRYAVLSTSADVIEDCPSGGEGLANLMKSTVARAPDWEGFVRRVQSKRYTYTRLSRLCMQVILGIRRTEYTMQEPGYIRILGFNNKGRELLSEIRNEESASLPVITNINKEKEKLSDEALQLLDLDCHASDVYNLVCGNDISSHSDYVHAPVIMT